MTNERRHSAEALSFLSSHSVGFFGYGHFGNLVHGYMPVIESDVRICDPLCPADGKRFFSFEETAKCDVLVLSVPMREFENVLRRVLACGGSGVLINVCSAQEHFVDLLKKLAPDRLWASFHGMFGPEGVKKREGNLEGLRVVATEHTLPIDVHEKVVTYFEGLGLQVVTMSSKEHDELLAESLFLTQYIGRAAALAKFVRTSIGTVSFDLLMDAVEIVSHDKELFRDVVKFVRYCANVRRRFHEGLAKADEEYEDALRAA